MTVINSRERLGGNAMHFLTGYNIVLKVARGFKVRVRRFGRIRFNISNALLVTTDDWYCRVIKLRTKNTLNCTYNIDCTVNKEPT